MRLGAAHNNPMRQQPGRWLMRLGFYELVAAMMVFSADHGLPWANHWQANLDNPGWLKRAMVNTFGRLTEQEKETVQLFYEDWLWYAEHFDLEPLVRLPHWAQVYLLNSTGQRIHSQGHFQSVLVELHGVTPKEALQQLDTQWYQFRGWW